ncbi:hypothetical protein [Sphingomonas radiodurans]|uniref:hypothetical protein n=1 Tax=Sphingomonas radiodurans TaxID=2890321 RepID=UPI001E5FF941|nr:hypothetical protein [Sphingomonas radiodurans]WBH18136.1 hypothetical protein LLW23_08610 [Sphingomonas radiodurans]
MTKTLGLPAGSFRLLSATTTTKLAQRMLASDRVIAGVSPLLTNAIPREILLSLLVAEDSARYISRAELDLSEGPSEAIITRWITVLLHEDLIEERAGMIALTPTGYDMIVRTLEGIYAAQRTLD